MNRARFVRVCLLFAVVAGLLVQGGAHVTAAGTGDFVPAPTSPEFAIDDAFALAVGRFNADAFDDIAVANIEPNNVTIMLGTGTGDFNVATTSPEPVGVDPSAIVVGRFNADAFDDLAVSNLGSGTVSILVADGTGNFSSAGNQPVGANPRGLTVGRFNADALDDLAVANVTTDNVSVLLGNGAGGFTAGGTFAAGARPRDVTAALINGDANVDLAVANESSNDVSILLGNGAGGFGAAMSRPTGANLLFAVEAGRFDADANVDLAVAASNSNAVVVMLGNGAGAFPTVTTEATGSSPRSIALGQFNGDTNIDLAVANEVSDDITILLGNGAGDFTAPSTSPEFGGDGPRNVAVGRFNGDDADDLAVANRQSDTVTILLNVVPGAAGGPGGPGPAPVPGSPGLDTHIESGPLARARTRTPTLAFSSTAAIFAPGVGVSFQCAIDTAVFTTCPTPFTTPKLKRGKWHVLAVRAVLASGTFDDTPASRRFFVKRRHRGSR